MHPKTITPEAQLQAIAVAHLQGFRDAYFEIYKEEPNIEVHQHQTKFFVYCSNTKQVLLTYGVTKRGKAGVRPTVETSYYAGLDQENETIYPGTDQGHFLAGSIFGYLMLKKTDTPPAMAIFHQNSGSNSGGSYAAIENYIKCKFKIGTVVLQTIIYKSFDVNTPAKGVTHILDKNDVKMIEWKNYTPYSYPQSSTYYADSVEEIDYESKDFIDKLTVNLNKINALYIDKCRYRALTNILNRYLKSKNIPAELKKSIRIHLKKAKEAKDKGLDESPSKTNNLNNINAIFEEVELESSFKNEKQEKETKDNIYNHIFCYLYDNHPLIAYKVEQLKDVITLFNSTKLKTTADYTESDLQKFGLRHKDAISIIKLAIQDIEKDHYLAKEAKELNHRISLLETHCAKKSNVRKKLFYEKMKERTKVRATLESENKENINVVTPLVSAQIPSIPQTPMKLCSLSTNSTPTNPTPLAIKALPTPLMDAGNKPSNVRSISAHCASKIQTNNAKLVIGNSPPKPQKTITKKKPKTGRIPSDPNRPNLLNKIFSQYNNHLPKKPQSLSK